MMAVGFGGGSDAHAPSISATPSGSSRRAVATIKFLHTHDRFCTFAASRAHQEA
jgi:hypothetical protein